MSTNKPIHARAAKAALSRVESLAKASPGVTFVRLAVVGGDGLDFEICSRGFYDEACSESEFICEARAVYEGSRLHSDVEF